MGATRGGRGGGGGIAIGGGAGIPAARTAAANPAVVIGSSESTETLPCKPGIDADVCDKLSSHSIATSPTAVAASAAVAAAAARHCSTDGGCMLA